MKLTHKLLGGLGQSFLASHTRPAHMLADSLQDNDVQMLSQNY